MIWVGDAWFHMKEMILKWMINNTHHAKVRLVDDRIVCIRYVDHQWQAYLYPLREHNGESKPQT